MIEKMVEKSAFDEQSARLRQIVIGEMLCGTRDRDDYGQIEAVFTWIKQNIRYIEDPVALDFYPSALVLDAIGGGDCDDHVILACAALASVGFTVGCRVIQTQGGDWHIYSLVWLPKNGPQTAIPFDTTWPDATKPGQEYPSSQCRYVKSWVFNFKGR